MSLPTNNENSIGKPTKSWQKSTTSSAGVVLFKCSKCNKTSKRKYNIHRHEKGCGVKFNVQPNQNINDTPPNSPLSSTSTPGSTPSSSRRSSVQRRTSSGSVLSASSTTKEILFTCSKCGKSFNRHDNMLRHFGQCGLRFNIVKTSAHKEVDNFKSHITKCLNRNLDIVNTLPNLAHILNFLEINDNPIMGSITHSSPNYRMERYVLLDYSIPVLKVLLQTSSIQLSHFIQTSTDRFFNDETIVLQPLTTGTEYYMLYDFNELRFESLNKSMLGSFNVIFQLLDKLKFDADGFKSLFISKLADSQYDSCNFINLLILLQHSITVLSLLSLQNLIKLSVKLCDLKRVLMKMSLTSLNPTENIHLVKCHIMKLIKSSQLELIQTFYQDTLSNLISENIGSHGINHHREDLDRLLANMSHENVPNDEFGVQDVSVVVIQKYNNGYNQKVLNNLINNKLNLIISRILNGSDLSNWLSIYGFDYINIETLIQKSINDFSFIVGFCMHDFLMTELSDIFNVNQVNNNRFNPINNNSFLNILQIYNNENRRLIIENGLDSIIQNLQLINIDN